MYIEWEEAMSSGLAEIDEQHKELIRRINELMDAMSQGRDKNEVENTLAFVIEYAMLHFSHEESCMEAYRCPAAARNRFEHQRFMQTFRTLSEQVSRDGVDTAHARALKGELTGWLRSHILETDSQLRPCVQLDPSTLQT